MGLRSLRPPLRAQIIEISLRYDDDPPSAGSAEPVCARPFSRAAQAADSIGVAGVPVLAVDHRRLAFAESRLCAKGEGRASAFGLQAFDRSRPLADVGETASITHTRPMKSHRRSRFNHPRDWFGPGIGKPLLPRTWEGWVLFLGFFAVIRALALSGFGYGPEDVRS